MGVTGGEQCSLCEHRQHQSSSSGELFNIHVSAVFSRRNGPETLTGKGFLGWYCAFRSRSDHHTSASKQFVLPEKYLLPQRSGRGNSNSSHERCFRYTHAWQLLRPSEPVIHLPMDQIRLGEHISQEPESGQDACETPMSWFDALDGHLQQITGLSPFYKNRAGKGMDQTQIRAKQIAGNSGGGNLTVEGVPGLHHDFFVRVHFHNRRYVRVPAVMSFLRLVRTPF